MYVIELDSQVWEESLESAGSGKGLPWIPSFPMGLDDPRDTGRSDWKEIDSNEIEGFVYVGKTQGGKGKFGWREAIDRRHDHHVKGGNLDWIGKIGPSPVVSKHGSKKDNIWDLDRCLTGLWESEISEKLESWYGWALGKAGYVVYGPHIHRTLKSPRAGRGEIKSFIGQNPFW